MIVTRDRSAALLLVVAWMLPTGLSAETVGSLIYEQGQAQIVRDLQEVPPQPGTPLEESDTLRTPATARAKVILNDETIIMIWDETEIRFDQLMINQIAGRRVIKLEQVNGSMRLIVDDFQGSSSEIEIRTPNARITLPGAGDVVVLQKGDGASTHVVAIAGKPTVAHIYPDYGGEVQLESQQSTRVGTDRAPSSPAFVSRGGFDKLIASLQWTLPQPVPEWDEFLDNRLQAYSKARFGQVRRLAARPFTPVRSVSEGLADQNIPGRPGEPRPEPTGGLEVTIECSGCVDGSLGGTP